MALQSLIRWLLPREDHYYDMIEELGRLGHDAAIALAAFETTPAAQVQQNVQAIEHKADDVVRRMEDALARTFVTPLDREDLHRLTSELDDIIDLANLTARSYGLYNIEKPTPAMIELSKTLITCTQMIREAVPHLRTHKFGDLIDGGRKVRDLEKAGDTVYRNAISDLFKAPSIDFRDLLKQKEALDHLENAVDHCDNVADLLANMAVKHG
jgi:predicted phosphate transport protein (TIGR00153 family)